jgi:hypothetical protein
MSRYLWLLFLVLFTLPVQGIGNKGQVIDDFEDGTFLEDPEWWIFGDLTLSNEYNNPKEGTYLGQQSLRMTGESNHWYLGGCGTYIGIELSYYNAIKLIVRGTGAESGAIRIELYDDDNKTVKIERHPQFPSETLADDRFVYNLAVDWTGWKVVEIPFVEFIDNNGGIGDDKWNPYQRNGSGGLIQLQLLALSSEKKGYVDLMIDSIHFVRTKKKKTRFIIPDMEKKS